MTRVERWVKSIVVAATPLLFVALVVIPAPVAEAAAPAWKLLAVTGPTNLPPVQSETQRVTVEAEGGSFQLTAGFRATIIDKSYFGVLSTEAGNPVATIKEVSGEGANFEVGSRVRGGGLPEEGETFVESCSPDCSGVDSKVTFSRPAERTVEEEVIIFTRQASVTAGEIPVGQEIASPEPEAIAPGTTVQSATGSSITLSRPPASGYFFFGSELPVTAVETTASVPYGASAAQLQSAFDSLPLLSGGAISVIEGPVGNGEHSYFLSFGGRFANRDVPEVAADADDLVGVHSTVDVFATVPGGAGTGEITINPANVGGIDTSGKYTVQLGPLPAGIVTRGVGRGEQWTCSGGRGEESVTCASEFPVLRLAASASIDIPIEVTGGAPLEASVPVTISGGNAGSATFQMPIKVSTEPVQQGIGALLAGAFDENGNPVTQAGAHPYSVVNYFLLNTSRRASGQITTLGDLRSVLVDLPAGFLGNPLATPRCPQSQLTPPEPKEGNSPTCNAAGRVGWFQPAINVFGELPAGFRTPFYNDVPAPGYAAEFTTLLAFPVQSLLGSVRSSEDAGIRISALNVPTFVSVFGAFAAFEGFPAGGGGKPFLSNPTSCAESAREAPSVRVQTETWQQPGIFSPVSSAQPPVTGCAGLRFGPGFSLQPTVAAGSSGTGAAVDLHVPQEGLTDPAGLATPTLKKAVVRLPAGMTLNPSAANGLQSCSEEQIGYLGSGFPLPNPIRFDEASPTCPDGSKLGTVEVDSPLLESPLEGTIYLAAQEENPFGSLLAVYLAIESPRFGLQIKLAGKVDLDPASGQLTATFDDNPQLPFEDLKLLLRGGGPRSTFATPEVCGHYGTSGELEPWSAPESGPAAEISEAGFDVSSGCSSSAGARPFSPTLEAGTTVTQAGAYGPLVIKVSRSDGDQELKSLDFTLPKGLLGGIAGIPYCSEASIREAERKSGRAEQASPSCSTASRLGSVEAAAGVGPEPFHAGGSVYLAGPYKGAPLSAVVVTPAVAGPIDLGDVVIRTPLYVDPETTQIAAKSDPIPTILKGIPLKLRSVAINLDRPGFTVNPTSCEPTAVTAQVGGSDGATAKPTNRFQVGGCDKLRFKPTLKLSLKGSTKRTGHPGLKAVLTYPRQGAYANIARAQVNLPHSEFLDQGNLNKTCTRPVLLEGKCPASSIYGKARAFTPLLDRPLEGPVYLVGGYGYKLPALVADLDGQIRVVLKGKVDTGKNKGIRNTFEAVPDAPVSRFVLQLKAGKKYSLLENSENLCAKPQRAIASFTAQNGLEEQTRPLITNQCAKKAKQRARMHAGRRKSGRH